jgi:PEP-CTERM motif
MRLVLLVAFACFVRCPCALAATITFEGFANTIYSSPIVRLGFTIGNVVGDEQHFHEIDSTQFGLPNNGTGVLLNDRDTRIFVDQGGTAFTLTSVDVASALGNGPADGLTITGYLLGGSTGVITLGSLGTGYTALLGGSLGTVDRLVFDGIGAGGGFVLDNLALNEGSAIPEPGTHALIGLGLAGMALLRRRA